MATDSSSSAAASGEAEALADAYRFFNEIGIIAQLSSTQMQRRLPHALNQSQFSVLNWFVRVDDEATPGRLAAAFQVSKGAMTNTLGKLSEKGFVSIAPDPTSGRQKLVTLTAAGRAARDDAIAATYPLLREFLARFDLEQLRAALPLLEDVRKYLDLQRS